jgi:hypothetical protein
MCWLGGEITGGLNEIVFTLVFVHAVNKLFEIGFRRVP